MKKLSKMLATLMVCFVCAFIFTACGDPEISSAFIKSGTIQTTIVRGEELDTSNLIVTFKYSDNKTKDVAVSDLTLSEIDIYTLGNQELTITYGEYSFKVNIKVVPTEADLTAITSLKSQLLIDFVSNGGTQFNKKEEFFDNDQPLYVGNDNAFDFRIFASGFDEDDELVTNVKNVSTTIKVEVQNSDKTFTNLTGQTLEDNVIINPMDSTLKFTETAKGKVFKVSVSAANRHEDYDEIDTSFSAIITVVDGYNVYEAKELSLYDNSENNGNGWADIKEEMGLENTTVNSLILQDNIFITKNDIPTKWFWTSSMANYATYRGKTNQTLAGSMVDNRNGYVYSRKIANGEEFNFIGNYFAINAKDLPKMVINDDGDPINTGDKESFMVAHTSLFKTGAKDEETTTAGTQANWQNLLFIGNGELVDDPRNSGGVLLMKNHLVDFTAYNTIINNFYNGFFMEGGDINNNNNGNYLLDHTKSYNCYNSLMYFWGAENVLIKNSEAIGTGGPAIITDHAGHDADGNGGRPTRVNVVESTIKSVITGKEPWFAMYEGSGAMLQQLTALDSAFNTISSTKTIVMGKIGEGDSAIPQVNAAFVMKSGGAEGMTDSKIRGYIRMFETEADYTAYYDPSSDGYMKTTYGLDMDRPQRDGKTFADLAREPEGGVEYIQSSGNGGYINNALDEEGKPVAGFDISINPETCEGLRYDVGRYINIYVRNGMGIMLEMVEKQSE